MDKSNDLGKLQKQLKTMLDTLQDGTNKLADEVKKIHTPKEKKVIKINDKECFISLIEDGRVMIQFPDINSSEEYFKEPPLYTNEQMRHSINGAEANGQQRGEKKIKDSFNEKGYFKRLFTTWL